MSWPNPFRRRGPKTVSAWGYVFDLTDEHFTPEEAHPLKFSYDVLAEECLARLDKISPPVRSALPRNVPVEVLPAGKADEAQPPSSDPPPPSAPTRDLYALLRDNAATDPKLQEMWTQVNTVPPWVDWDQIARGQEVFYRYGGAAITGLAYQSLLGGMGAARVVETLARTGGFSTKVARRRLFETTQHILQCTRSLEGLQPGGDGFASTIRVRFLHSAVRNRIMKLAKERPEYYNVEEYGVPINDLDSIATIATFSATLIWLSFPAQGLFLRKQEIADYIAVWRYIAYLIGCPDKYFETPSKAKAAMECLMYYEIRPTETSKLLANNIIKSLEDQPPAYTSGDMLIASARWMNGHELCDALGLPRPGLYYYSLILGQCIFFCAFCYTYRSIPSWDRWKNDLLKKGLYNMIVHGSWALAGTETTFDFKYVPEFDTITHLDDGKDIKKEKRINEKRNLKWLIYGVGGLGLTSYVGYKLVSGVIRLGFRLWRWAA